MSDWKVTLMFERREDGGLRLWSPELPGLVLSNPDPFLVISDISLVLKEFYERRYSWKWPGSERGGEGKVTR